MHVASVTCTLGVRAPVSRHGAVLCWRGAGALPAAHATLSAEGCRAVPVSEQCLRCAACCAQVEDGIPTITLYAEPQVRRAGGARGD